MECLVRTKFRHPKQCPKLLAHGVKGEHGCNQGWKCSMFHPMMCWDSVRKYKCQKESCKYQHIKGTRKRREVAAPPPPQPTPSNAAVAQAMTLTPGTPAPTTTTVATEGRGFLELATGLRMDMAALVKAMETQEMLLNNLMKENRASWVPPGQPTIGAPWISAITSR